VHLPSYSITMAECIAKFTQKQPRSVSSVTLNYRHHIHLQTRSITVSKFVPLCARSAASNLLNHDHAVHLSVQSITASKCIPKSARLPPPRTSPNSLGQGLGVYLWVHSILIYWCTSNWWQAPVAASLDTLCVDVSRYRYIDENTNCIYEVWIFLDNK
jgi:hypothetical protein